MNLAELNQTIKDFVRERDWEQFHNPKDLAMALGIEVAELQELMLWVNTSDSGERVDERRVEVEDEIGDIMVYLLRFCQVTGIDPIQATARKMEKNAQKYPVERSRGNSRKYTEL